ncbi:hypothetical protein [Haloferax sp. YSSS75]|uniref:hypothetical protein n=1 Tax=Haloferax sp. YSSS75 TaxID=3388564 RepID=UPI00398CA735
MSNRRVEAEAGSESVLGQTLTRIRPTSGVSTRTLAGLCGLVPVLVATLYRVVHNAPGDLTGGLSELATLWLPATIIGPAVAAFLLASTAETVWERVGSAFVGGFSLVALASPLAWYPAAIGIVVGGAMVVWSRWERLGQERPTPVIRELGVAGVLVAGVAFSLAATAGVAPATLRPLGSAVALVGIGATPALVGWDSRSLYVGALAAILTFSFATTTPYVAGAVLLVGGGVVGTPLALVLFGVGGGVTALTHAVVSRRPDVAAGGALLLAAGVPSTLLGAAGVLVAVTLFASESRGEHR